jgi:hypothetical protein
MMGLLERKEGDPDGHLGGSWWKTMQSVSREMAEKARACGADLT